MAERQDQGFLARWSRRKQAARQAEREQEPEHRAPQGPARTADAEAAQPPDAAGPAAALPDPATLDASSDFSVFLGRDVPIETHRAALRRLWRADPFYNRHDGLSDYMEDFTDQARAVKGLRTAYRVGRGFLKQAGEAKDHPEPAPALQQPGGDQQRIAAASETSAPTPPADPAPDTAPAAELAPSPPQSGGPGPRRPRALPRRR
jgi:hypothetical protein